MRWSPAMRSARAGRKAGRSGGGWRVAGSGSGPSHHRGWTVGTATGSDQHLSRDSRETLLECILRSMEFWIFYRLVVIGFHHRHRVAIKELYHH